MTEPSPSELPPDRPLGRFDLGYLDVYCPDLTGAGAPPTKVKLVLWCADSSEYHLAATEPHRWPHGKTDPRELCASAPRFLRDVRNRLEPEFFKVLLAARFPGATDQEQHRALRLDTIYCGPHSPFSVVLTYHYAQCAPLVVEFPPAVIPRDTCGICASCDPDGRARERLLVDLEAAAARGEIPQNSDAMAMMQQLRAAQRLIAAARTLDAPPGSPRRAEAMAEAEADVERMIREGAVPTPDLAREAEGLRARLRQGALLARAEEALTVPGRPKVIALLDLTKALDAGALPAGEVADRGRELLAQLREQLKAAIAPPPDEQIR